VIDLLWEPPGKGESCRAATRVANQMRSIDAFSFEHSTHVVDFAGIKSVGGW